MITTIIISFILGILFAFVQYILKNKKQKKLNSAWESYNNKLDKMINLLEEDEGNKDIIFSLKKYNDKILIKNLAKSYVYNFYFENDYSYKNITPVINNNLYKTTPNFGLYSMNKYNHFLEASQQLPLLNSLKIPV